MRKEKKWQDAEGTEWLCTIEWYPANKEEEYMNKEWTLKKVDNGYILSGPHYTQVYNDFKQLVKQLEFIFGEEEKKKKGAKRK